MKCLKPLFTKIRDKDTGHLEFVKYANRLMVLICEEGFAYSNALSSDRGSSTEDLTSGSAVVSERIIQTSAGECFLKTTETVFNSNSSPSVITPTGSKFLGNVM
jgi:uracil phosphoribosyltransferase